MSTPIIAGSGGAHNAINDANTSGMNWTDAQRQAMATIFADFAKTVESKITSFNAGNPP